MAIKRFSKGDKVIVKSGLDIKKRYGGIGVSSEMVEMAGKTLTISRIYKHPNPKYSGYEGYYYVDEHAWCWTDEMLEECGLIIEEPFRDTNAEAEDIKPTDIGLLKDLFTGV